LITGLGGTIVVASAGNPVDWAMKLLDEAETAEEVRVILRSSARAAVQAQGATVVELNGDLCHYADEDAMSPLWKGQRFPVTACISGWAMQRGESVVIPDIRSDGRIPQEAYRPTFVRSLVMVPIMIGQPVGAIGAYWGHLHHPSDDDVAALESLASAAATALERILGPPDHVRGTGPVGGWSA
jgi:GAF domain-containing protein